MITYPVVEKFISINGEGQKAGELAAFIRMRGCNLSCNYCDTSWANTMDCPCEFLSTEELITWLTEHKIKNVTLTGGEPLLTTGIDTFIETLGSSGFSVEIETNGSVALDCFHIFYIVRPLLWIINVRTAEWNRRCVQIIFLYCFLKIPLNSLSVALLIWKKQEQSVRNTKLLTIVLFF